MVERKSSRRRTRLKKMGCRCRRSMAAEARALISAAGKELLDGVFGKAPQALVGDPKNPLAAQVTMIGRTIHRPPDETREQWLAEHTVNWESAHL